MDLIEIKNIESPENHWYYKSKFNLIDYIIKDEKYNCILDVGAGSGIFSKHLISNGIKSAICVDIAYKEKTTDGPIQYTNELKNNSADLVLIIDMLEHVSNDKAALESVVNSVLSGTKFIITVPAFMFLWSEHDNILGHKRRYLLKNIRHLAEGLCLKTTDCFYYYAIPFPIVATQRIFNKILKNNSYRTDLRDHSKIINSLAVHLMSLERLFCRHNTYFGITAVYVGVKY